MTTPEAAPLRLAEGPVPLRPLRDSADSVGDEHGCTTPAGPSCNGAEVGCPVLGIPARSGRMSNGGYSGHQRYQSRRSRRSGREDWLEKIRRNYKANLRPGLVQLRLSKIFGRLKISADALLPRPELTPHLALTMSSAKNSNKYIKKVVITPTLNKLQAFTPSMEIGWLRLQFAVVYDWANGQWDLSYRAKTKWSKGSKIAHKFQHMDTERLSLSTDWSLRQELPQFGGSLGARRQPKVEPDIGKFNVDFNRLKVSCHM